MNRIEGTGNINNAINIELNTIKPYYEQIKTFGDGHTIPNIHSLQLDG